MITFDTETCGFHGPIVLIQYQVSDGEIILYSPWIETIQATLDLLEWLTTDTVCGFNLAFDWFHVCQMYTVLLLLKEQVGGEKYPLDYINAYALLEPEARDGPCLKPKSAMDVMLHARKTKYQSTMARKPIVIRRVPEQLAEALANELESRVHLKDIYFAKRKDKNRTQWQIEPRDDGFADIVLRFNASSALKALATDALNLKVDPLTRGESFPDGKPVERGYAPFALAVGSPDDWKGSWPEMLRIHNSHWGYNIIAREYATNDVVYTRGLYKHFGSPAAGDDDSILSCMVGAVRWRGYAIDIPGITALRAKAKKISDSIPFHSAPKKVFYYITETMDPVVVAVMDKSTAAPVLKALLEDADDDTCVRIQKCISARKAAKEIENYDKLLLAGRFHASFKVIGTRSTRMSGSDKLNPQGIKKAKWVRDKFPLSSAPLTLVGGDFSAFEVSIAAAVYKDPALTEQLCTCYECAYVCTLEEFNLDKCPRCGCSGTEQEPGWKRKLHGLLAMEFYPETSYVDILASSGTGDDKYLIGKQGVFGALFGGDWNTWVQRLGIDEEVARKAYDNWGKRYKGVGEFRDSIKDKYCSMQQPGGIGTRVEWHEPAEYIETILGFRRYFTLENDICRVLFNLANKPPRGWKELKIKCVRRDRQQTVGGATMSALYAAAFNIQAMSMRAAANHLIQSTGATITKALQCRLWQLQPPGVADWQIQPMNIHDEIMAPVLPHLKGKVTEIIDDFVIEYRKIIPLIKMDWNNNLKTWADK